MRRSLRSANEGIGKVMKGTSGVQLSSLMATAPFPARGRGLCGVFEHMIKAGRRTANRGFAPPIELYKRRKIATTVNLWPQSRLPKVATILGLCSPKVETFGKGWD